MTVSPPYNSMSTTAHSEPIFTKCCCCFPLRIGCFILGYMNLLFNTIHTLAYLTVTAYIGVSTHGFDHFDKEPHADQTPEIESVERPYLNEIGILLVVVLCANIVWLVVNVACLVGLHKKRPGPIRVYAGFAAARLMVFLAVFLYQTVTSNASTQTIFTYSIDVGLAAYFILVYYVYAAQLEREAVTAPQRPDDSVRDFAFVYPTIDKQILVA